MLHRAALAAILAALSLTVAGTAYSQVANPGAVEATRSSAPNVALQRAGSNRGLVRIPTGPVIVYATTSFSCNNSNGSTTTYTLSVDGGSCGTAGPNNGPANQGLCGNTSGGSASANCTNGCIKTEGSGSCTQVTTQPR